MAGKTKREQAARPTPPETSDITGGYEPFRIDTTGEPVAEGPRVPLFYVDDREYTVPARIPAALSIRAIKVAATEGRDAAVWFLVEQAVPPEAIAELTEGEASKFVTREQVRAMFTELGARYFGQAEEDTGK